MFTNKANTASFGVGKKKGKNERMIKRKRRKRKK